MKWTLAAVLLTIASIGVSLIRPCMGSAAVIPVGKMLGSDSFTAGRVAYRALRIASVQGVKTVEAKCPALAGNYVLQGEDGQVHISIMQDGCTRITITRSTGYLGKITREEHRYRVDGTEQPDSGWYGGNEKYRGTARFTPTLLRIDLRASDGSTRTMLFSLTPERDLIEDSLDNGKRLGGGPTVATRQ